MENLLAMNWIGLLFVGLGTMFLFGEILVKARGIFAILGVVIISFYFSSMIFNPTTLVMIIIIYFFSLLLIIIDGKLLNDGTFGLIGLVGMMVTIGIAAPNITAGLYSIIGLILGGALSFSFLKIFKHRNMWNKMTLKDRLTKEAGYSTLTEEFVELVDKEAITVTDLRPSGTIKLNELEYSAQSEGQWILKNKQVKIVYVDGTKVVVREIE